jgi:hypothetical protein
VKLFASVAIIGLLLAATPAFAADFSVSVTIDREGAEPKLAVVEMKGGRCRTTNGSKSRPRKSSVCKAIDDEIHRDEAKYTTLPWINSPDVPSFIVTYRGPKSNWTKQTGVAPDAQSKEREALRQLATHVLATAQ